MTTDPRDQKPDHDIERDLEAVRHALSGPENPEPPQLLDQAVLNVARREVQSQGTHWSKRQPLRWLGAFATATVILLAFTLVIEQEPLAPVPAETEADGLILDRDEEMPAKSKLRMDGYETQPRAAAPAMLEKKVIEESPPLQETADAVTDPDAWIQRLLQLRKNQQQDLFEAEMAAFQEAFPDYPLPPELEQ